MKKYNLVISIGRECGSGGHEIGEKLAQHYNIPLYDRNILERLAEKTGQDPEKLAQIDEKVTGRLFRSSRRNIFAQDQGMLMSKMTSSDILFLQEKALLEEMAETESFVIIGRGANDILRDYPTTLHLFVYAPESFKIPRVKEFYHLDTDKDAKAKMLQVDKERRDYFHYYTNMEWAAIDGHDFMIDSSILGIDGTVDLIIYMATKKLDRYRKQAE